MRHDTQQLLRDQAVGSAIGYYTRDVIRVAAETVQRLQPQDGVPSGMRESQLRNVVNVVIGARSVEEVAAFILYQMGRSTNSRQWLHGQFGDTVVQDLMRGPVREAAIEARKMAETTIRTARGGIELGTEERQKIFDETYIALARQYLGYLNRLFYFADRTRRWDELAQMAKGGM